MTQRRQLVLAAVAVIAAAIVSPHVVPLYDGVGFPDEPYRYVGKSDTATATSVNQTVFVSDLNQYGAAASSQESGPQISLYFQQKSVIMPSGASSFSVKAIPEAPTDQPAPGSIAGNVYTVSASSKSGAPRFDNSKSALFMRLPGDKPAYKIAVVYRPGDSGSWQTLATTKTGSDVFKAGFHGPGQYALATGLNAPTAASQPATSPWYQPWLKLLPWILFGGILLTVVLVIRFRKPKSSHPQRHEP